MFNDWLPVAESKGKAFQLVAMLKSDDNGSNVEGFGIWVPLTFISPEKLNPGGLELKKDCKAGCKVDSTFPFSPLIFKVVTVGWIPLIISTFSAVREYGVCKLSSSVHGAVGAWDYYSNSPILIPEAFNLTPYLQPLIRNPWPYSEHPTIDPNLRIWPLCFTLSPCTSDISDSWKLMDTGSQRARAQHQSWSHVCLYYLPPKLRSYFRYMFWHNQIDQMEIYKNAPWQCFSDYHSSRTLPLVNYCTILNCLAWLVTLGWCAKILLLRCQTWWLLVK